MDEGLELIKDYKDCIKYLENLDSFNYDDLYSWACIKYAQWIEKDKEYKLGITGGTMPPKNNRERAINSLMNLKSTFEKIAVINGLNLD